MIAVPLAQNRSCLRRVYLCDFIKQTHDGFISLRNFLIGNRFLENAYTNDPVNEFMSKFVVNLLNERNAAYTQTLEPTLRQINLESTGARGLPIESTEKNLTGLISKVASLGTAASQLKMISRVNIGEIITMEDVLRAQIVSEEISIIREVAYGSVSFIIDF